MIKEHKIGVESKNFDITEFGDRLNKDGIAYFPNFINSTLLKKLIKEADELLAAHGRRVDVLIPSTDNTPRKYVTVSRESVVKYAPTISDLYKSRSLVSFLSDLTQSVIVTCPYKPEQIVVNKMDEIDDTHGWHWDDYAYSLVLVLDAPSSNSGAQVEYIDGTSWDKSTAKVNEYLSNNSARSLQVSTGSAYLLLGKRVMHRVSPMLGLALERSFALLMPQRMSTT